MTNGFDKIAPGRWAKLNVAVDAILVLFALLVAAGRGSFFAEPSALEVAAAALAAWLIVTAVARLYSPCTPRSKADDLLLGAVAVAAVTGVTGATATAVAGLAFEPQLFAPLLFVLTTLTRLAFVRPLAVRAEQNDSVLIVGTGSLGAVTYDYLTRVQQPPRRVLGFLRFPDEPLVVPGATAPVLGEAFQLPLVLRDEVVHEVYVAGRITRVGEQMQEIVKLCEEVGVPFALPLHSLRFERATLLSSSPARDGYLHYLTSTPRPIHYAVKRLIDIVASTAALLLLAPLLVAVALAIKATSRGPVFYRQERVGLHGAPFNLLKFRSMIYDAERLRTELERYNEQSGPVFKMKQDPRVTPVGRFIRRFSIDELPQLINILRGDMTIVGPRPALPEEVTKYEEWQRRRLSVRPGLTCYWQVGGRNAIGFEEWMRLDLRYVDNWSLAVDARLILQTFPAVLGGKGAS